MKDKTNGKRSGAMKKSETGYQADWKIKVLNNGYNSTAKLVFLRIADFGENGCWMSNETFGEGYSRSVRTIRQAVSDLWSKGDIIVTGWNNQSRKMYAAGHPRVKPALNALYEQAKRSGKVESVEQYQKKIRLRQ